MLDSQAVVVAVLLVCVTAHLHQGHSVTFTIPNVTRVNVEEQHRKLAGNQQGDIEIHCDKNSSSRVIPGASRGSIIFIEQYQHNGEEEYVVVDETGLVTIWNQNLTLQLATFDLNASVSAVTNRERERGVGENRLALVCGEEVVEYSLDSRSEIHRHALNQTVLTAIYTPSALLISTNDTLLVLDNNGTQLKEISTPQGSIILMSRHNHNAWASQPNEVIAIAIKNGTTSLLHLSFKGVDSAQTLPSAVSSLTYCRGRKQKGKGHNHRRVEQDLIVLGIGEDTLLVREGSYSKKLQFPERVADVVCLEESLFVLSEGGKLHEVELEHGEHSGSRFAAFAGAFFLFLILAVAVYQIAKRRFHKSEQSVHTHEEFELQERMMQR